MADMYMTLISLCRTLSDIALDHECNSGCGCDMSVYDPICIDGVEYFTPCHAGCSNTVSNSSSGKKVNKKYLGGVSWLLLFQTFSLKPYTHNNRHP